MINVFFNTCEYLNINSFWSCISPMWCNVNFKPGKSDPGFRIWTEKRLRKVQNMYREDGQLMSFAEISIKYDIPKYLQLKSLISSSQNHSLDIPVNSSLQVAIIRHCYDKNFNLISV